MSKKKAEREARKLIRDYSLAIGGSILIAVFIRFFVLEAYRMPSRAMQPAVEPGDTLFVSKFSYGFRIPGSQSRIGASVPQYGDVVVLEFPDEPGREYIKRVVGLPGDRVQLGKSALLLNGKPVTVPAVNNDTCTTEVLPNSKSYEVCYEPPVLILENEITVPESHVYVTGDLRSAPFEARRLKSAGLAPVSLIRGKALFVWLSIQPPGSMGTGSDWFSRIRMDRLFKRIH